MDRAKQYAAYNKSKDTTIHPLQSLGSTKRSSMTSTLAPFLPSSKRASIRSSCNECRNRSSQ